MQFSAIDEICKEFNIDYTLDVEHIIKELTKIQATIHPDANPNYSVEDSEKLSRIEEAKKFLRKNSGQNLMSVSDVLDIIKLVKNQDVIMYKETEKIADSIKESSKTIIKKMKRHYLPRKITVTSIWSVITLLWTFPSAIIDHPMLRDLISYNGFNFLLLIVWLSSLLVAVIILLFAYFDENYMKNMFQFLENVDNQYTLFSGFLKQLEYKENDNEKFISKELESYIYNTVCYDNIFYCDYECVEIPKHHLLSLQYKAFQKKLFKHKKTKKQHFFKYKYMNLPKQLDYHIKEIIPKISDMIIARALEGGVITKVNEKGWYDKYYVNQ